MMISDEKWGERAMAQGSTWPMKKRHKYEARRR
jgi:hypothetical protein